MRREELPVPDATSGPATIGPGVGFSTLSELEAAAAERATALAWAYIQGGSGEERTVRANRAAFRRQTLVPRVFSGPVAVDTRSRLLGTPVALPVFVAPTAYHGLLTPEAEAATARATSRAGALSIFSTLSTLSLEAIAESAPEAPRWFQLYLQPEFARSAELVARAEKAGYRAIVVTADTPLLAVRDRQRLGGFNFDASPPLGNGPGISPPPRYPRWEGGRFRLPPECAPAWEVLDRLTAATRLPLVIKGILSPSDARKALDHGAKAVIVSNHGGRQLDGAPASLDVLRGVAREAGSEAEVYLDGGVRRASDVLVALALGARAVGLGRPVLWALAAGGEPGVARLFELLHLEFASSMALLGAHSLEDITPDLLGPPSMAVPEDARTLSVRRGADARVSGE